MAVHLNARLKTRFIPFLFTAAILITLGESLARASSEGGPSSGEVPSAVAPAESDESLGVTREEIRAVMSEGVDPSRLDRRPGFSPIVVAPRPGEHPSTASLNARVDDESRPAAHYLDFTDELPAQPQEASPDQR